MGCSPQFRRNGPGEIFNYQRGMAVCQSVEYCFLNSMKKSLLATGRVLASSEKHAFCQCHLTLLCLFEGKYETLEI